VTKFAMIVLYDSKSCIHTLIVVSFHAYFGLATIFSSQIIIFSKLNTPKGVATFFLKLCSLVASNSFYAELYGEIRTRRRNFFFLNNIFIVI